MSRDAKNHDHVVKQLKFFLISNKWEQYVILYQKNKPNSILCRGSSDYKKPSLNTLELIISCVTNCQNFILWQTNRWMSTFRSTLKWPVRVCILKYKWKSVKQLQAKSSHRIRNWKVRRSNKHFFSDLFNARNRPGSTWPIARVATRKYPTCSKDYRHNHLCSKYQ